MARSRRILAAALMIAALAGLLTPARADFVGDFELTTQACAAAVGDASVDLTQAGNAVTFTGTVLCNGAASATITSLTLTPVAPPGPQVSGSTASCGPCSAAPIVATGSALGGPGVYSVRMTFSAMGPGGTYADLVRRADFLWNGVAGQPARYCQDPAAESQLPPEGPPGPAACSSSITPPPVVAPSVYGCNGSFQAPSIGSCTFTLPPSMDWMFRVQGTAVGGATLGLQPSVTVTLKAGTTTLATCRDVYAAGLAFCRGVGPSGMSTPGSALSCTAGGSLAGAFRCEAIPD